MRMHGDETGQIVMRQQQGIGSRCCWQRKDVVLVKSDFGESNESGSWRGIGARAAHCAISFGCCARFDIRLASRVIVHTAGAEPASAVFGAVSCCSNRQNLNCKQTSDCENGCRAQQVYSSNVRIGHHQLEV